MATKKINLKFRSLADFHRSFPTEKSCIRFLERKLWPHGVISPYDPTSKVYMRGDGLYRCKNTGKNFNVRIGTIFEGSTEHMLSGYPDIIVENVKSSSLNKNMNMDL